MSKAPSTRSQRVLSIAQMSSCSGPLLASVETTCLNYSASAFFRAFTATGQCRGAGAWGAFGFCFVGVFYAERRHFMNPSWTLFETESRNSLQLVSYPFQQRNFSLQLPWTEMLVWVGFGFWIAPLCSSGSLARRLDRAWVCFGENCARFIKKPTSHPNQDFSLPSQIL